MKKLIIAAALLMVPALAFSAPGNGTDLSWNDCIGGTAGTAASNKNFVCTGTANQNYLLIIQFKVNQDLVDAYAWTGSIDYINQTSDLGDNVTGFWRLEANCPGNNIRGVGTSTTPPGSCTDAGIADVTDGGTAGLSGFAWFSNNDQYYQPSPGRAKLNVGYARDTGIPITAGGNYYVMHLVFNNRNKVACPDGCTDPGAFVLNNLFVERIAQTSIDVSGADKGSICGLTNNGGQSLCDATPVQNTTWGKLKAMYR